MFNLSNTIRSFGSCWSSYFLSSVPMHV